MASLFSEPLAALTTVFTPPCPASWLLTTTKTPSQLPPFPSPGPPSCDPPAWGDNLDAGGFRFYSPAICPTGFSVGPNCAVSRTRTAEGFPPITDGETAVYCVPSGHTCTTDTTDFRGGVWGFSAAAPTPGAPVVVGPAIQIRWRKGDLSILKTHPLTPGLFLVGASATGQPETTADGTAGVVIVPLPSARSDSVPAPVPTTPTAGPGPTSQTMSPQFDDISDVLETPPAAPDRTSVRQSSVPESDDGSSPSSSGSSWAEGVGPVALSVSLVALVAVILGFALIRRYRRKHLEHDGQASTPTGTGGWVDRCRRQVMNRFRAAPEADTRQIERRDAELGIEAPTAEPGVTQLYGSSDNPAELDAAETKPLPPLPALPPRPRQTWVSRISTRLSMKPKASATEGHASVATSRRTTTSSIAGEDYAAEWAAFAKEKWPSNEMVNGLTCPPKSVDKHTSVPRIVVEADTTPLAPKGHARNGSQGLSRLSGRSDGTFGGSPSSPKGPLSPRSPHSPQTPLSPMSFHSPAFSPNPQSPRAFPKDDFP